MSAIPNQTAASGGSGASMAERFDNAPNESDKNVVEQFAGGFVDSFKTPIDGAKQLVGINPATDANKEQSTAEMVGHFAGSSALFIGTTLLARRIPGVGNLAGGRIASIAAGGTLGFLTPVSESGGITERLMNTGLGAGTMAALEFGPGALNRVPGMAGDSFKSSLMRYSAANAVAGALNTEGQSLIRTGQLASAEELALGAGTWALTGAAFHSAGYPFARMKQEQLAAKALTAERPWQFKEVQPLDAASLKPGQQLAPGHYAVNFESQGQQRTFNLYVSEGAVKSGQPAPVVTFMHGLTPKGTADHIIRELSWNRMADEHGAVVAYLHGKSGLKGPLTGDVHSWNEPRFGYTKPDPNYNDSVTFGNMMNIIRQHVPQAHTDGIAVTGFSLGGKMANRLAATRNDVAAVGTIHGTIDKFDEAVMRDGIGLRGKDAIFILGDSDRVLPLRNGAGGRSFFTMLLENSGLSRPARQFEFWREQAGSGQEFTVHADNFTKRYWQGPNGGPRVSEYVVKGGAHAIDGAHAKKNMIQALMGVPKPPEYFDSRTQTFEFLMKSIRRHIEQTTPAKANAV